MNDSSQTRKLFTFNSGGWVLLLAFFFMLVAAAVVLWPLYQTGFHRAVGDGKNIDTYGFDLSDLTVPRATFVASGKAKDEIRAITPALVETATPAEVRLANKNEHIHFIIDSDRVIGVTFNGESRAYPVRILNLHEVVNDIVGGVPIAVTWSSLCDSAVVFDRRIDANAALVEFGVSGLLYNSNTVLFDRQNDPKNESLWPQLSFHAIAGPAAKTPAKRLKLLDFEFTTWKAWVDDHPDTRILLGLRTLKRAYGDAQDPFNLYLADDVLEFPVDPLWKQPGVPRKSPAVAVSDPRGESWKLVRPESLGNSPGSAAHEEHIWTFVFAWYAQHPNDTDYSAFGPK